jgi:NSS family neurotransmitter:Na+ symporter
MPALFILIIFLAIRALTLPGAGRGLAFYLNPDFSKFSSTVLFFAVAQAFFSLSVGNGAMMTYASYLSKKDNLVSSAGWVCFFDTLVAILAGIIIFPTLFTSPEIVPGEFVADTGQVFPMVLSKMPGGYVFGAMFFTLLLVAVLTSTLSLLEVPTAFLVDEKKWTRRKAATFLGALAFIIGIPAALSNGGVKLFTKWGVMIKMDFIFISLGMTIGALFISLFLAYAWGVKNALKEISFGNSRFKLKSLWIFNIKYLAPVVIAILLIIITNIFG